LDAVIPTRLSDLPPYVAGRSGVDLCRERGVLGDILDLSSNENPLGPPAGAVDAMREAASSAHRYPDPMARRLREALAEHHDVEPDMVLTASGAESIISLISRAFLEPGDEVIVPSPTFPVYRITAIVGHATPVEVRLREHAYRLPDFLGAVSARSKLVFIGSPNNPTGTYLPAPDVRALLDHLPDRALLVLDEAYRLFAEAPDIPYGLAEMRGNPRVLVLRSFSKSHGLAGLRIGYLIASPAIVDLLARVRDAFAVNTLAQVAAVAALGDKQHLAETVRTNREGRALLSAAFAERGLAHPASEGNFLWVDTGVASGEVWLRLLDRGVVVRSGALWSAPSHLRVTVGTRPEIGRFLAALDEALAG
jgi:histidinol-phosphate aminotransferase